MTTFSVSFLSPSSLFPLSFLSFFSLPSLPFSPSSLLPLFPLLSPSDFKGLLQSCHLIWMCDWMEESLNNTVEHFFNGSPLAVEIKEEIRSVSSLQGRLGGGGERGERGREGGRGRGREGAAFSMCNRTLVPLTTPSVCVVDCCHYFSLIPRLCGRSETFLSSHATWV